MATFLTTRKMAPELAGRIERSIESSYRPARPTIFAPRLRMSALRLGLFLAVAAGTYSFVLARRQHAEELEKARAPLLDVVRGQNTLLTVDQKNFMSRVEPCLIGLSGAYPGDLLADEVRAPTAFDRALARPSVYVRGPVAAFASAAGIEDAAAASSKDSFLICLLDPPPSRAEKVVLGKVRAMYGGDAAMADRTGHARRLDDVVAGLRQLRWPWEERVRGAAKIRELDKIKAELERVPVETTRRAVAGELLIAAMDEPGEGGPADLDGERAHHVRVGIMELGTSKILLRTRPRVDPSWMSPATRASFAGAVDGCALAFDIHASLRR